MTPNRPPGCFALAAALLAASPSIVAQTPAGTVTRLEAVVVSSTRTETSVFDTPASISVIDGFDLQDNDLQINLSEALGGVPGLLIQNRQNYAQDLQVAIRGFGSRSSFGVRGVRLYVDDIPATMPDGQGQTSNIDIASIDRVEVLRGPFSSLYGNASGGVIQVYTRDGESPPEATASFAAGSYGTRRSALQASGASHVGSTGMQYLASGSHFSTDGYRDHSAARKTLGNVKLNFTMADDSTLSLVGNHVNLWAQDPLGLTRDAFEADPRQVVPGALLYDTRKTVRQTQGGLVYRRPVGDGHEFRALLYYGQRDTTQFLSIPAAVQSAPGQAGGVIVLEREYMGTDLRLSTRGMLAGRPLTVHTGIAWDSMREDRRGYENFRGSPPYRQLGVEGALRRNERNDSRNVDPYLQLSWEATPDWTLDAGLRYSNVRFSLDDNYIVPGNGDDSGNTRFQRLLPFVSLGYRVNPGWRVYASVGQGFETPTFNEVSYRPDNVGGLNLGLQPALNTTVEIGSKAEIAGGLFTAALFETRTRDEIVVAASNQGRTSYQNAGRTLRRGLELAWNARVADDWRVDLAYTWLDARYRDDCSSGGCNATTAPERVIASGNRIPGIPEHVAWASLGWEPASGWRAGIEARYVGKVYVNDGNTEAAPGYFTTALAGGYVWFAGPWELNAFARLDNLFNRRYAGSVIVNDGNGRYYEPAPGRNWAAGLTASYSF